MQLEGSFKTPIKRGAMEGAISISGEHRRRYTYHFRDRAKMLSATRRFKRLLRRQGRFIGQAPKTRQKRRTAPKTGVLRVHAYACAHGNDSDGAKRDANEPPPAPQILWEKIKNMVMRAEQPESGEYLIYSLNH